MFWFNDVDELLPVAVASPVVVDEVPLELLVAVPWLVFTPEPPGLFCPLTARLRLPLPTVVLSPLIAVAVPLLRTVPCCSTMVIDPPVPDTVVGFDADVLPVAVALPVPVPAEPLLELPVLPEVLDCA
jgi:hypothetical protein